jgi:hypothetical protein
MVGIEGLRGGCCWLTSFVHFLFTVSSAPAIPCTPAVVAILLCRHPPARCRQFSHRIVPGEGAGSAGHESASLPCAESLISFIPFFFPAQALEALRKLRSEKTQEVKEMKLKLEHLKTEKDIASVRCSCSHAAQY